MSNEQLTRLPPPSIDWQARADAAEAKLKALAGLVERWPELDCASWCSDLRCNCGAEDQNLARAATRLALGLEE